MASSHGDLRHLLPASYKRLISEWLEEDCPSFDYGGFVVGESEGEAKLLGKSEVCSNYLLCFQFIAGTVNGGEWNGSLMYNLNDRV
jgi:hypothetical protein